VKDLARRANKLRRRVYRETAAGSVNRTAELDHRMAYAEMVGLLEGARLGVSSTGAAVALWRACRERGLRAWCYRFGFSESFSQTVTIIEVNGVPQIHDAYFNLSYPSGLYDVLTSLRHGEPVIADRELRDRKTYVMDPAREPPEAARWLKQHADRELEPAGGLRRFELLWNPDTFIAMHPAIQPVYRELTARGYPADLQFAMLHPIAVFDGARWHRERAEMPLLRAYELDSPITALRVVSRDLEAERARLAEKAERVARLEAELTETKAQFSVATRRSCAERETWLQQKAALQAAETALTGELAETRAKLTAAVDLRAQRDSQIAQLRAEIEDASRQSRLQQDALDALEVEKREWDGARLRLETEIRELHARLEAGSHENKQLRAFSTALTSRAEAAEERIVEIGDCFPPLIDEVSRLRSDRDAMSRENARLAAQLAASPWARLRSLWRRVAGKLGADD
jgi:hypothetical protein